MGMDVYGIEPYTEAGEYFRANVWSWRPLWTYVCDVCNIDEETRERGHYNDGHVIDEDAATSIGMVLGSLLKSGAVHTYAERREKILAELPDEQCKYCECTSRPPETHYSFNVEWIEEFAEFAKQSGGFEIC